MRQICIQPTQWARLPELHETPALDETDFACMTAVRDVLARHGKLQRFALHLAHRHFDLAPGETLIERPDPDGRTQHVTVGRLDQERDAVPTTWLFDDTPLSASGFAGRIYCVCTSDSVVFSGCAKHGRSQNPPERTVRNEEGDKARVQRENADYERGFPVAGHDFVRERAEDQGRDR